MDKTIILLSLILLFNKHVFSEQIFEVIDDQNNGVHSKIYFGDFKQHKGDTDQKGLFISQEPCSPNTLIIARPNDPFIESGKKICSENKNKIIVKVTRKPVFTFLIEQRESFATLGNFGAAALVANEISARTVNENEAYNNQELAISYLAKHFSLLSPALTYDPVQKKSVATPEMLEAVRGFQTENRIKVTGIIDYETLAKAAGIDIGSIIFQPELY